MVAVYSVWRLIGCSLYFGNGYKQMSSISAVVIGVPGMLIVSFLPLFEGDEKLTVKELWTQSGLENTGAAISNTIVLVCWSVLVLMAGVLLPPFRTARSLMSTYTLPPTMTGLSSYLEKTAKPDNNDEIVSNNIHLFIDLHGKAGMTKFEPRMWRNEDLFTPLKVLMNKLEILGEYSILKFEDTVPGGEPSPETFSCYA
jgi:hypothetical protein